MYLSDSGIEAQRAGLDGFMGEERLQGAKPQPCCWNISCPCLWSTRLGENYVFVPLHHGTLEPPRGGASCYGEGNPLVPL